MPEDAARRTAGLVVTLLTDRGLTVATCESLTGGLVGATITDVPGASLVYRGGFVTYASDLKVRWAGVDADLVDFRGVVNQPTAEQMARGVLETSGADIAIACTGVAGPTSQDGEPAGSVWLACAHGEQLRSAHHTFEGDRAQVRWQTVEHALRLVIETVTGSDVE